MKVSFESFVSWTWLRYGTWVLILLWKVKATTAIEWARNASAALAYCQEKASLLATANVQKHKESAAVSKLGLGHSLTPRNFHCSLILFVMMGLCKGWMLNGRGNMRIGWRLWWGWRVGIVVLLLTLGQLGVVWTSTLGNPYDILGVHRKANVQDIRRAYKNLVVKWHPDKNQVGPFLRLWLSNQGGNKVSNRHITDCYKNLRV